MHIDNMLTLANRSAEHLLIALTALCPRQRSSCQMPGEIDTARVTASTPCPPPHHRPQPDDDMAPPPPYRPPLPTSCTT